MKELQIWFTYRQTFLLFLFQVLSSKGFILDQYVIILDDSDRFPLFLLEDKVARFC